MNNINGKSYYNWSCIKVRDLLHKIISGISFKYYGANNEVVVVHHVENIPKEIFQTLKSMPEVQVLCSGSRVSCGSSQNKHEPVVAKLPVNSELSQECLAYGDLSLKETMPTPNYLSLLFKLCEESAITPTFLITKDIEFDYELPSIEVSDIQNYLKDDGNHLIEKVSAGLKLAECDSCDIKVFSCKKTLKEHYALVIGDVNSGKTPMVRVHSSCFTGDVLHSKHCDCHDQLHLSIKKIDEYGCGVLLYLNQEGRGIGLVNKLRAYNLQRQGMDTVDANNAIGFADDIRDFSIAANILKNLGIKKIDLLSNNPKKAKKLQENGVEINSVLPHQISINDDIKNYYHTKNKKLGHKLDLSEE